MFQRKLKERIKRLQIANLVQDKINTTSLHMFGDLVTDIDKLEKEVKQLKADINMLKDLAILSGHNVNDKQTSN